MAGSPVSQQTRRRELLRAWTRTVRELARQAWGSGPPLAGAVAVTITYFYDSHPPDVDNIPKPVLDALKGIVYHDDGQVYDLLCRKRALSADVLIRNPSTTLLGALRGGRPLLHVRMAEAITGEIVL